MLVHGFNQRARKLVPLLMFTAIPKSSLLSAAATPTSYSSASFCRPTLSPLHLATMSSTNLDDVSQQKKVLRAEVKKHLRSMDPALRSQEDVEIQRIVLESPWFKSCKRLCAYISCAALREVDTSKILAESLKDSSQGGDSQMRKKLYVPWVEDKNRNMRMLYITKLDDLVPNSMNILEPAPLTAEGEEREDVMLAKEPVDLLLLPGLAFDKCGRRLGRGGGYYDTFLAKYSELVKDQNWKQPLSIALSYSVQILDDGVIPMTSTDFSIDALVTPSGVIPITPAARERFQ